MKRENKTKTKEQLSPEMVIQICEIGRKRFMDKVSLESGVEQRWRVHSESGDNDGDDESVREKWDDRDRDSSSPG